MLMSYMKKIKRAWLCAMLVFSCLFASSQARISVKGVVKSSSGEPIEGASVVVQKTNAGTSTNALGQFSIEAPVGGVIVITATGYEKQEVKVSGTDALTVVMTQTVSQMDQVVVVGYRSQTKKLLTASVATVKKEILETSPVGNLTQTLQG